MLPAALDKNLCLELRLIQSYAGSGIRWKAMLESSLHKKLCL